MAAVLFERAVGTIFSPVQGAPTLGAGRKAGARPGELAPAFSPPRKRWPVASLSIRHCWVRGPVVFRTILCMLRAALLLLAAHSLRALGSRLARPQDRSYHPHAILACGVSHDALLWCERCSESTCTCSNSLTCREVMRSQGLPLALAGGEPRARIYPRARLLACRDASNRSHNRSRSRSQARARESERDTGAPDDPSHLPPLGIPLVARVNVGMCYTQTRACLRSLRPHDTLYPPRACPQLDAG